MMHITAPRTSGRQAVQAMVLGIAFAIAGVGLAAMGVSASDASFSLQPAGVPAALIANSALAITAADQAEAEAAADQIAVGDPELDPRWRNGLPR